MNDNSEIVSDEDDDSNESRNSILKFVQRSMTIKQILHKLASVTKISTLSERQRRSWIPIGDIVSLLLVDLLIGILISSYLIVLVPNLYELMQEQIDKVLGILLQILEWLSGAPAGLKLNASLNSLLGRFFSYNLHLWRTYISILEPITKFLLLSMVDAGRFAGFTVQIALVKDLISVTTFHIYCLYIYATRLFNIELNALKSLGHLFFGRKWNPLRNRIDSVQLSHSEMFLSSLAFTIAVFLSPTIFIYYIVFLCLRLPILFLESILKFLVRIANSTEPITIALAIFNSSLIEHEIYLEPTMTEEHEGVTTVTYAVQTRSTYKIRFPNFARAFKHIVVQMAKSEVIAY